jgi:hypothetical protein
VGESLRSNPLTAIASVDAAVFDGVAELRGFATYDGQLAAIKMARAIDGIRDVANHLQLSTAAAPVRAGGDMQRRQTESEASVSAVDKRLDETLEETFPASDAPANTPITGVRPVPLPSSD